MTDEQQQFSALYTYMTKTVIGQSHLAERLILTLLAGGHILTEGAPGLAKTRAAKELANCLQASFKRIQFTPDLLPGDLIGTDIYHPNDGSFNFHKGPLFSNIVLADEINRAPAKVQSALLESMAEGQISSGHQTYLLPELFIVMATQNPLDHEGTYALPEAQLDRFLLNVQVSYPSASDEKKILQFIRHEAANSNAPIPPSITQETVFRARKAIYALHMVPSVEDYIVRIIDATRHSQNAAGISDHLTCYASPRATLALDYVSRAYAWLKGRDYVSPEDVNAIAHDVLRHRIKLSFKAISAGYTTEILISQLLKKVTVC